ncbi:hypothetical protein JR316_0005036 [Psilocybe cubensis]|uniref:RlpA-like protein double-psi beta-barrel domain-containing protein n=2 Tax=Psilocybe cubensis TaxID=181762 RepID=A0A8H8CLZ0_PSICU|nr:hypothetical protein JR316_0005036 [Psilocybe cubensis]KAH9482936.1 hypothetical protein JR316_0005036 [Psilocybe cubensis]
MRPLRVTVAFFFAPILAFAGQATSARAALSESRYSRAHSLGDNYSFDPRDGWQSVNVTNLEYKYRRNTSNGDRSHSISDKKSTAHPKSGLGTTISNVVKGVFQGLKGFGKPEPVTITWYTGHDLENPSCWANGKWAPTDESFACALTMEGWTTRPKCFKFLELCKTSKKCVFVRVVDTCAGCAAGSKHVDLTKAAFGQLANFDEGILTVQLRAATEPEGWYEKLWGPKVDDKD